MEALRYHVAPDLTETDGVLCGAAGSHGQGGEKERLSFSQQSKAQVWFNMKPDSIQSVTVLVFFFFSTVCLQNLEIFWFTGDETCRRH